MRPKIAISHAVSQSRIQIFFVKLSVWLAGGKPVSMTPQNQTIIGSFDGLLLYGGADICPNRYGLERKLNYAYDLERDALEFDILKNANENNKPVLGICRGAQLINVFHQGSLHIDVAKAYEKASYPSNLIGYIFFRKKIKIKQDSLLFSLIKKTNTKVNSLHKQCVDQVGNGLVPTAHENNGVIQAIEDQHKKFYLGVQFHPEFLIYKKSIRNIFKAFIASAKQQ